MVDRYLHEIRELHTHPYLNQVYGVHETFFVFAVFSRHFLTIIPYPSDDCIEFLSYVHTFFILVNILLVFIRTTNIYFTPIFLKLLQNFYKTFLFSKYTLYICLHGKQEKTEPIEIQLRLLQGRGCIGSGAS